MLQPRPQQNTHQRARRLQGFISRHSPAAYAKVEAHRLDDWHAPTRFIIPNNLTIVVSRYLIHSVACYARFIRGVSLQFPIYSPQLFLQSTGAM